MIKIIKKFFTSQKGATGTEIAILLGLLSVVSIGAIATIGYKTNSIFQNTNRSITNSMNGLNTSSGSGSSGNPTSPAETTNTAPRLTTLTLPNLSTGGVSSVQINATDTETPTSLIFSLRSAPNSLPPGTTLSSTGRIEGTSTVDGSYTITVRVTDPQGLYDEKAILFYQQAQTSLLSGQFKKHTPFIDINPIATRFLEQQILMEML